MQRVEQVDSVLPGVERVEIHEPSLGAKSHGIEDATQQDVHPFPDGGPTLFTDVSRDVGPGRQPFGIREREGTRAHHQSLNGQPPIHRATGVQASILLAGFGAVRVSRIGRARGGKGRRILPPVLRRPRLSG